MNNIIKNLPNYKLTIGVMGSASGYIMHNPRIVKAAREIGRQIASHGCILGNGACPGLPDEAAKGAKEKGGIVYGVSPAISLESHVERYRSPIEHYDNFLFTGVGLMMRDIINIRSCEGVIILPGGTGTLNEFTVAYDEGKPIGVLTGHDGVADHIKDILKYCHREVTDRMIFSDDPKKLVEGLLEIIQRVGSEGTLDEYLIGHEGAVTKIENQFRKEGQLQLLDPENKKK